MNRLFWLDILRGIAVLGVLFHHAIWPQIKPIFTPYIFGNGGYMAVSLFFLLSGYIIALPYAEGRRNFDNNKNIFTFYKHRVIRLFPLFWISLFIGILIFGSNFSQIFFVFTTLAGFSPIYFFPSINPVYWSLFVEIHMSIIFPWIIKISQKISFTKILWFFVLLAYFVQFFGYNIPFDNPHTTPYRDNVFGHLDEFVAGIFLAYFLKNSSQITYFFQKKLHLFLFLIFGIVVLFLWIILADLTRYGQFFSITMTIPIEISALRNIFLIIWWTAIMFFAIFSPFSKNFFTQSLEFIGIRCYSFYIWHMMILLVFQKFSLPYTGIATLFYFLVVFIVSVFSFEFFEKRMTMWLK